MDNQQKLDKDHLIQKGAVHERGKIYSIGFHKVALFEDGFRYFLGGSLLSTSIKGKTIADFDAIFESVVNC